MKTIRIATRRSPLALAQTAEIKQALLANDPLLTIDVVPFITEGDRRLEVSLSKIGGKGLFTQVLEAALLNQEVDMIVHSMKDLPVQRPEPLILHTALPRQDPRDAWISPHLASPNTAPDGAIIGTSSQRRALQLKQHYPQLTIKPLQGNIHTRLDKLRQGQYDAIILAAAGLQRVQLTEHIAMLLPPNIMLPAIGQAALAVEFCRHNKAIREILAKICHDPTEVCIQAERAVAQYLNADCHSPIAAYATIQQHQITLTACVTNGQQTLHAQHTLPKQAAHQLGQYVANQLIQAGAQALLDHLPDPD